MRVFVYNNHIKINVLLIHIKDKYKFVSAIIQMRKYEIK
jgi:hypothetical protein